MPIGRVASSGRRAAVILRRGAALGVGACALLVVGIVYAARPLQQARQAYWTPSGPPCRPISHQTLLALNLHLGQVFTFQNLRLVRAAGGAFCSGRSERTGLAPAVVAGSTICQLTNPIAFSVTTEGREYDFHPGIAVPATVTVDGGAVRCVLASNFKNGD